MVDEPNIKKPPLPPPAGGRQIPPLNRPLPPPGLKVPSLPPKFAPGQGLTRPPAAPIPPLSGASASPVETASVKELEVRLKKMEENAREAEDTKRKLERALAEMEIKLKEEKEKALSQMIKAREEESLSLKMEQALKEMQEKARRDRREQELEEARLRAEEKVKDLERRLNEEREAWVINLKKQMEMRDTDTKQAELQIESRFRDLEQRWLEEKSILTHALKAKEDELAKLSLQIPEFQAQARRAQEDANYSAELTKKKIEQELQAKQEEFQREKRALSDKLEMRERELVSLKAQLAMIDAQVKTAQESSQRLLSDKERSWQTQFSELQRDLFSLRQAKEQMQADTTRAHTENVALRKEINEWEKKQNLWEQAVRDLKRKLEEQESLERSHRAEKQSWITKQEERAFVENRLRETLAQSEKNFRDAMAQKEQEITYLRLELQSLENRLEKKYEKEKQEFLLMMERQVQEEVSVKTELAIKELGEIREMVITELEGLEKNVNQQQSELLQKEAELASALEKIKSLEEKINDEKNFYGSRARLLENEFRAQFVSFSQKLKEERERMLDETTKLSKALAEKESLIQRLEREVQEEKKSREMEADKLKAAVAFQPPPIPAASPEEKNPLLNQSPQQTNGKSFFGKVWKYLNRTVIVVNLKTVPKIQKQEEKS